MNPRMLPFAAAAIGALLIVAGSSLYMVNQAEQALILRLGAHRATIKDPGLHFKVPFIEDVVRYDLRLLPLDPPAEEIILGDSKRIVVDTFARYRIEDPLKFYQTRRTNQRPRPDVAGGVVGHALGHGSGDAAVAVVGRTHQDHGGYPEGGERTPPVMVRRGRRVSAALTCLRKPASPTTA